MNHTNVKIALDRRRIKTDGSYPIVLRLCHHGKSLSIRTGLSIPEKYWDFDSGEIKKSYKGYDGIIRVNNLLTKKKIEALSIIHKLKDQGKLNSLSILDLKQRIIQPKGKSTFFTFTSKIIEDLRQSNRIGTSNSYQSVLNVIKVFRDGKDLSFDELTLSFIKDFEIYHLSKGNSYNGLAVYLKTIRAIYNQAIKQGFADKDSYPFDNYTIRLTRTRKRAISIESIRKIENLEIPKGEKLYLYKNIFLMSFYMMGTSFSDLAHLKLKNIKDGRVFFVRQRTKRPYDIKINEPLRSIFSEYIINKEEDDYVLPIIMRKKYVNQHKDVTWSRQRYNKGLKQLGKKAGIEENLTSYVARHTFASTANNLEVPVTAISQMLGHEKLTTTQVYLADINKSVIDNYNERIVNPE
jgi:site-specific recombinase XerD